MRKKEIILERVEITDLGAEGVSIGKVDNKVIFVPYVAPGDIVDIRITRKKNKYAEGLAVNYHRMSGFRTTPFCEHFGICGGCKWQHLEYEKQLYYKHKQVIDNFERIGKVTFPSPLPIIGSEQQKHYRNKLEYTFSDRRWFLPEEPFDNGSDNAAALGFHIPGRFDKILDLKECHLQHPLSNTIRLAVKKLCKELNLTFQNLRTHKGAMRNLIIRNSNTNDWMVIVVFGETDNTQAQNRLLEQIKNKFPQITSLWSVVNPKVNDSISDLTPQLYHGKPYMTERMFDIEYRIGPKAFYQTNSAQAKKLYQTTCDFSQLIGNELVFDLYTGTGTIANLLARKARWVVGIEYIEEAVADARTNSVINGNQNTTFISGDMSKVLNQSFIAIHGAPDVIVTDPPRAGMHQKVIENILHANPKRIVYVSCNPATQARDLALLCPTYEIKKVQPVDMFPNTHHVENIVLLEKT